MPEWETFNLASGCETRQKSKEEYLKVIIYIDEQINESLQYLPTLLPNHFLLLMALPTVLHQPLWGFLNIRANVCLL
jgi:hypothetical protein